MLTVAELELLSLAITKGEEYFAGLRTRVNAGTATKEDLDNATSKLDMDVNAMLFARSEQRKREAAATNDGTTQPTTPGPATKQGVPKPAMPQASTGEEHKGAVAKKEESSIPPGTKPTGPN